MSNGQRLAARDLLAVPNLVTLLRIALVPAVLALMAAGERTGAAAVLVALFATDGLDGLLARRLDRVTELGKLLDPLADKLAVGAVLLSLVLRGEFPAWAFALVLLRDVLIAVGGAVMTRRTGVVPAALPVGKFALVALAAVTAVYVADLRVFEPAALLLCVAAVIVSGVGYGVAALRGPGGRRQGPGRRDGAAPSPGGTPAPGEKG